MCAYALASVLGTDGAATNGGIVIAVPALASMSGAAAAGAIGTTGAGASCATVTPIAIGCIVTADGADALRSVG
jgi:hypothetical protein